MTTASVIESVAHYVPERIVTNDELAQYMDTSDEWIRSRTGIRERRFVEEGTSCADLAEVAARTALAEAGNPTPDLLIAATLSPDYYFPGIGTLLQDRLSLPTIPALDIRAQCSGLVYGLSCADAYIRSGQAKTVLLVCAEVQSPVLELNDRGRDMAVLFGDGAAALLLRAEACALAPKVQNSQRGVIDSVLGSDGSGAELLCMRTPGTSVPGFLRQSDLDSGACHPQMEGRQVFKHAVSRMGETAQQLFKQNHCRPEDIDLLIPHQANMRINEALRSQLDLEESKVFNTIEHYGNTTAATIPIGMSEAVAAGRLQKGMLVLTLAFGAGFTWGGNLLRW